MRQLSQVRDHAIIRDNSQVLPITSHDGYHCARAGKNLQNIAIDLFSTGTEEEQLH